MCSGVRLFVSLPMYAPMKLLECFLCVLCLCACVCVWFVYFSVCCDVFVCVFTVLAVYTCALCIVVYIMHLVCVQ